jgi:hypothetical protein
MYASIWDKYFPVIRILMKRSSDAEQILDFNRIDFERTGKGRKTVYKFNIEFIDGKLTSNIRDNELAQTLALVMMEDDVTKLLLLQNNYEFNFTSKFQLYIKNTGKHQNDHSQEEINTEQNSLPVLNDQQASGETILKNSESAIADEARYKNK